MTTKHMPVDPRNLYCAVIDAWNDRDAKGMASLFALDGSVVGFDGSQVNSRSAIAAHLAGVFEDHPTAKYVAAIREVRELSPTTAMVRSIAGMIPSGSDDFKPELTTVHTLVATLHPTGWQTAMLQSTPAAWHGRPKDLAAVLTELRALHAAAD